MRGTMKIRIKSTQIFENHQETVVEEIEDAEVSFLDGVMRIKYGENEILVNQLEHELNLNRTQNSLKVKVNEKNVLNYETTYGKIILETYGEQIEIQEIPLKVILKYQITLNGTEEYSNIVEMIEV